MPLTYARYKGRPLKFPTQQNAPLKQVIRVSYKAKGHAEVPGGVHAYSRRRVGEMTVEVLDASGSQRPGEREGGYRLPQQLRAIQQAHWFTRTECVT